MINWRILNHTGQLQEIETLSVNTACLIYKHSSTCGVSAMAKMRLEHDWDFSEEEIVPYFFDILENRSLSAEIATVFKTHHESPQVLLIKNGECIYDATQFDISVAELRECYED